MQLQNKVAAQQVQGRQMPLVSARMQNMVKPVRSSASCNAKAVSVQRQVVAARRLQRSQLVVRAFGPANGTTEKTASPLNIVFVSAEVAPWSKTGGLGDVVGGLPVEVRRQHGARLRLMLQQYLFSPYLRCPLQLAKRGHKVITIAPR